jgi:hypothetical protein
LVSDASIPTCLCTLTIRVDMFIVSSKAASKCACTNNKVLDASSATLLTENMSVPSSDEESQVSSASQETVCDEEKGNHQMCSICLEEYALGDSISWSKNQKCVHAFHTSCIKEWLEQINREGRCPVCRGPYLEESNIASDPSIVDPENQMKSESQDIDAQPCSIHEITFKPRTLCIVHGLIV